MEIREKTGVTKKQNKWNDPFYAYARCQKGNYHRLYSKWLGMKTKKSPFK